MARRFQRPDRATREGKTGPVANTSIAFGDHSHDYHVYQGGRRHAAEIALITRGESPQNAARQPVEPDPVRTGGGMVFSEMTTAKVSKTLQTPVTPCGREATRITKR